MTTETTFKEPVENITNQTLVERSISFLGSPKFLIPSVLIVGLVLIVTAPRITYLPRELVKSIGVALLVGCVSVLFDRVLFVSAIQADLRKTTEDMNSKIETLAEHSKLIERRYTGTMLPEVDRVIKEGTSNFLGFLLRSLENGDSLTILETFVDQVRLSDLNNSKLYDALRKVLKEKRDLKINFICLKCAECTRQQILARAFLSREMQDYINNISAFWDFVSELMSQFPDRVRAREIEFLPSLAAFVVEKRGAVSSDIELQRPLYDFLGDLPDGLGIREDISKAFIIRSPHEVYYSSLVSTSSHLAPYFYRRCLGGISDDINVAYVNMCWLLGSPFSPDGWHARKTTEARSLFDHTYLQRVATWRQVVR